MGTIVAIVPLAYGPVDPDTECRNWTQDIDGTDVRMTCHAGVMQPIQWACNHALGRTPRVLLVKLTRYDSLHTEDSANATPDEWGLEWCWPDDVKNARSRSFRYLHAYRATDGTSGTSVASIEHRQYISGAWTDTSIDGSQYRVVAATRTPDKWVQGNWTIDRGITPGGESREGCLLNNNFQTASLVVQEDVRPWLESDDNYCPQPPRTGDPIIGGQWLTEACAAFHDHRTTNLPIVASWMAWGRITGANSFPSYDTSLSADTATQDGVRIDSTTFLNILDVTSTAWSETTPGWRVNSESCGVGINGTIKHTVRVLAKATTSDGTVRFTTGAGTKDLTITAGGSPAWYGSDSDYVTTDPGVSNTSTSSSMNKIDVLGKAGAAGTLEIYGIRAWTIYG